MKKNLQTAFITRQHMLSRDFELYYYNDHNLSKVDLHSHNYYEFYFFMEGDVSIQIGTEVYPIHFGDIMLVPPHIPHRPIIHSTASPYRRFVFWISQEYCNHLLQISKDYAYLMQHVQVSQNYFFPTDRITFNAIQSKLLRDQHFISRIDHGAHGRINGFAATHGHHDLMVRVIADIAAALQIVVDLNL